MKKEDVFKTIKKIINECGLEKRIYVSDKDFEIADFHMVNDIYLGNRGKKLFKFNDIERISYTYNDVFSIGRYSNTFFVLIIEFDQDKKFYYELDENGAEIWIALDEKQIEVIEGMEEVDKFLDDYNLKKSKKDKIICSLETLRIYEDDNDLERAEVWYKEAIKYMQENIYQKGNDDLLYTIVSAAYEYKDIEQNIFNLKEWVIKLIEEKKIYSYLEYINHADYMMYRKEEYITDCETYILKLKKEIEETK